MSETSSENALAAHYDGLWKGAAPVVLAGSAEIDPWLSHSRQDARRGLTLLAWPSEAVTESIGRFVEQLRSVEPDQRYQPASDQHFARPLRDCEQFVNALAAARRTDFGSTKVERLELVFGDWFHTANNEERVASFELH